jgi:hypothetical protein
MFLEEEGVELRAWCTVWVAAPGAPSIRAPHLLQNSLSWGGAAEHDGQSLNWLSFPAQLIYGTDGFRDCTTEPLAGGLNATALGSGWSGIRK